jgi:hypothetical protein
MIMMPLLALSGLFTLPVCPVHQFLCLLWLSSFCFNSCFFIPSPQLIIFLFLIFVYPPAQIIKCCLSRCVRHICANIWWLWMLKKLDYDIITSVRGAWQLLVILSVIVIPISIHHGDFWNIWYINDSMSKPLFGMRISGLITIYWISDSLLHPRFLVRKFAV